MKYYCGGHWHILFVRNMPVTCNGGLEHVVDVCQVCALVAHQKEEAVLGTVDIKKLQLPFVAHNRW
jgi:hypothetical protein